MSNTNAVTYVFKCHRCGFFYGEGMVHHCPTALTPGVTTTVTLYPINVTTTSTLPSNEVTP